MPNLAIRLIGFPPGFMGRERIMQQPRISGLPLLLFDYKEQ